ncbi:MAG: response regulator [Planctomycetes bacterium]|nr:response regulator [Planctomycetota bacterium]
MVDDNPDLLEIVQAQLSPRSIEVTPFNTPGPLHAALQKTRPDLILVDLGLPFLDGFELIERIRSDPKLARIPIVILTADHSLSARVKAIQLHVNGFLTKPYEAKDLIALVERASDAALAQA